MKNRLFLLFAIATVAVAGLHGPQVEAAARRVYVQVAPAQVQTAPLQVQQTYSASCDYAQTYQQTYAASCDVGSYSDSCSGPMMMRVRARSFSGCDGSLSSSCDGSEYMSRRARMRRR